MKFFVKKEKKQDPLLQTYFVSLLSLVLCVTMFLGTTFAWFSSDVTSQDNQIFVGTLSVKLSQMKDVDWAEVGGATTLAAGQEDPNLILPKDVRWEPGYTFITWLKVENPGDLSANYRLKMALDTAAATYTESKTALDAVGGNFVVYANTSVTYENYIKPAKFEDMTKEGSGWDYVGTLAEVMAGKSIVSGKLNGAEEGEAAPSKEFAFAIHMNDDTPASTDIMGAKLQGITVKLEAWQASGEEDSLGVDYDRFVSTPEELAAAFAEGGKVILIDDVELTDALMVPAAKEVYLNLNGYTISQTKACTESYQMISNYGTLTVTDTSPDKKGKLSFTDNGAGDPNYNWGSYTICNNGRLVIESGTIEHLGAQSKHCILPIFQYSGSMEINGGTISCPGYRSLRLWHGTVVINGGTFQGQVWVQCVGDGASLTINGGSFAPSAGDYSSVFVNNNKPAPADPEDPTYDVAFSITGGSFATKVGCDNAEALKGCITGGEFTDAAKQGTNEILFAAGK